MKLIEKMVGYKATDKNMKCRSFQFELGKLHIHDGELVMCESGFHFCKYPSGVWYYFNEPETRVFKVEAYDVHPECDGSGAVVKYVARKIKFIEEIKIDGKGNTGDNNTGHYNTGDWNTGHYNTGDWNTGHYNTGIGNTGDWNTGHRNTGNWNTGDNNIGNCNIGHCNTGFGNATNRSAGAFCVNEPKFISFDVQTNLTYDKYIEKFPESIKLSYELLKDDPIDFEKYKNIPGITPEKLKKLHSKFKKARAN